MGMVLLARFYERNEALIVAGALEAAGVVVFVENGRQVELQPFHEIALGGYRLMVPEEELGQALAVIDEARRSPIIEGGTLSQRTYIFGSLLILVLFGFFVPLRTSTWRDADEAGLESARRVSGGMAVVVLAKFSSLPEAVVARSLLEAEGIGVVMPEQGLVAGQLDAGVMGGWRLLVIDEELEAARQILIDAKVEI